MIYVWTPMYSMYASQSRAHGNRDIVISVLYHVAPTLCPKSLKSMQYCTLHWYLIILWASLPRPYGYKQCSGLYRHLSRPARWPPWLATWWRVHCLCLPAHVQERQRTTATRQIKLLLRRLQPAVMARTLKPWTKLEDISKWHSLFFLVHYA